MAELRKSHSNFILRKKRQLTSKGSLYERDWMTVSELDGFAPGTLPVYASGNFKMTVRNERSGKKKYSFSNWLLNDEGDDKWTLSLIKEEKLKVKNELIKPNYSSILDFAYYGSAVELIRGTANDLIMRYPAEIYTANNSVEYYNGSKFEYITGVTENPFEIDVWSEYVKPNEIDNPFRYMCLSWEKYEVVHGDWESGEPEPVTSWTPGNIIKNKCPKDRDKIFSGARINGLTFEGKYVNGKTYLICDEKDYHIRLQKKYIDEIFESFDDFERVLLNRDSIPMYKAKFMTPRETERGVITHERAYIWPLLKGKWNLDFESGSYTSYLENLLYIANYYDEIRTDNIWRSYTHESIKNFDWTTPKDTYVPEIDGHIIDTERLEAILRVCGRQFDDLKRYIENIKFTANVSYDSKNNMPDEALGKFLEMSGWDVKNTAPISDNEFIHDELYPGRHVRYNAEDVNKEFLKRMILNSRNILSKKGTRAGIEAVYSMFGIFDMRYGEKMKYCDSAETVGFTIDEYEVMVNDYITGDTTGQITGGTADLIYRMNREKNNFSTRFEDYLSDYVGLMTEEKFIIDGIKYIVPWYNIDYEYDGYPYYQMFGGWGKRERKNVMLPELAPNVSEIHSDEMFSIYDESVKNIKVMDDFVKLNETPIGYLKEGDIYYVISTIGAPNCEDASGYSHYVFFTGNTEDFSGTVMPYNDEYYWCLVNNSEFNVPESSMTWYAKEIIYMETIHDINAGNNPHDGKLRYDDGEEYFKYYEQLFKGSFEYDLFSDYKNRIAVENSRRNYDSRFNTESMPPLPDETSAITEVGFVLADKKQDNSKIWYFLSDDNGIYESTPGDYSGTSLYYAETKEYNKPGYKSPAASGFTGTTANDFPLEYKPREDVQNAPIATGRTNTAITITGDELVLEDNITKIHPDGPDETWSYSTINTKKVLITYHLPWEMEDYVTDVVEYYVKQVIPSTVILEFKWDYIGVSPRPPQRIPYARLSLSPIYQSIRSNETGATIDINSINVEGIGIAEESTT